MQRREGRAGVFWGCSSYPECRETLPDDQGRPAKSSALGAGSTCPTCGTHTLVQRTMGKGKNQGRKFLGCSGYPDCRFFAWEAS